MYLDQRLCSRPKYSSKKWGEYLDEAEHRKSCNDTEYKIYKEHFVEHMQEYQENNKNELDVCYNHYAEAITEDFFKRHYVLLNEKRAKHVLSRCKVLVLTANPIEKAVFHYMITKQTSEKIRRIICGDTIFFVMKWGSYWIAHVHQPETGSYKDMGSYATIQKAIEYFIPIIIISLGVAFGIDYKTQNIGDVIVSKRVLPYSENKRDEEKLKPDRSQDKAIDKWLHVRLINAVGFMDSVTYGDILSGGSVLSSFEEKDKICTGYTKADYIIGGEMEGNALFQYANTVGIPGVVIKGICDWGVAKNDIFPNNPIIEEHFKDSLQALAMTQAFLKCTPLFRDPELFSEPKISNVDLLQKEQQVNRKCILISALLLLFIGVSRIIIQGFPIPVSDSVYNFITSPVPILLISVCMFAVLLLNSFQLSVFRKLKYNTKWELEDAKSFYEYADYIEDEREKNIKHDRLE